MIRALIYSRLGGDPVERQTRTGTAMATASVAVNVARQDVDEETEWFSLAAFGRVADELVRHDKGDLLAALGALYRRRFTGRDGQEREQWALTADAIVSARTVRPSGERKAQRNGDVNRQREAVQQAQAPEPVPFDDPIDDLGR